jgi:O-glycosyl hydrolase
MYKFFLILLSFFSLQYCLHAQVMNISVDASIKYQTIDNFGASDCWSMQKIGGWYSAQKNRIADLLFSIDKGIGLSAWRFNIGAGINFTTINHSWRTVETFEVDQNIYDWSRQEEERWFLQAAKDRGVDQFIAFVNSPPGRMTRNGYTNCTDGLGSTNLKINFVNQYAKYLVDILKHFRENWGISFDFISPINEPQWEWNSDSNQEGNRASNEDIELIVDALYNELQNQSVHTKISIVESGDLQSWFRENQTMESKYGKTYGNYLAELIADPNINTKIGSHFCGHSYWSDRIGTQLVQDREELFSQIFPFLNNGWKYWMTEYAVLDGPLGQGGHGRDLTMKTALDVARIIHYDLTTLHVSAWQWWTAVSPENYKDGLIYTDYLNDPTSQSIIESKLLWAFGNFSRYIRPGSIRIKLSGANDKYGLLGSAFINAEKDNLVIIFVNMSNSDKSVLVDLSGLDSNKKIYSYHPYITSDNSGDDLKEYDLFSSDSVFNIPSRSIVTLVGEIVDSTFAVLPDDYKLYQNYPNPFNNKTKFNYYLPEPGNVNISIYSLMGERIKTLVNNEKKNGLNFNAWDGTNNNNEMVSSGVYLYSMKVGNIQKNRKMIFIQ